MNIEEMKANESRLWESYQAIKAEHGVPINKALTEWSAANRAVRLEEERVKMREEIRAELAAEGSAK